MAIMTKKKKYPPIETVPDDPENIKLSKADFVAKQKKRKETDRKLKEYKELLLSGELPDEAGGNTQDPAGEISIMEEELSILAEEAAKAEAENNNEESEEKVKELKKKVKVLRMNIGKAKKALANS